MIWKSIKEEWPYSNDDVWLRYTRDGVNYIEEIVHEKSLDRFDCLGIPEWRELDPPEWMSEHQKDKFEQMRQQGVSWINRVSNIDTEDYDQRNPS